MEMKCSLIKAQFAIIQHCSWELPLALTTTQNVFSCTYNQLSIVKFKDDSKKKSSAKKNIAGLIYKTVFHQFLP